jgi:hypothetical protein
MKRSPAERQEKPAPEKARLDHPGRDLDLNAGLSFVL